MNDPQKYLDHPELLMGENPFLEELSPFMTPTVMANRLSKTPLSKSPWKSLPPLYREPLLAFSTEHFAPTRMLLPVGASLQGLIRGALVQRNPTRREEQRRTNAIGLAPGIQEITSYPRLDAAAMILAGITGMGKTAVVKRVLSLVAPRQVVDYGPSAVCGWEKLRQVIYLYVDQPSNGSRGALLKAILLAVDHVAETDYAELYKRTVNIDTLLVLVCKVLTVHRVALLVIDEKQERNFQDSPWSNEFILFYLSLMNLGVAILLVGNPLAFRHLQMFSQVMRRFSVGGIHTLRPSKSSDEAWWKEDLCPRIRRFSVVEHCALDAADRAKFEFEHSAGIPALLQQLNVECQKVALRRASGSEVTLTMEDCRLALKSPSLKELLTIAEQVRTTDPSTVYMQDIVGSEDGDLQDQGGFKVPSAVTVDALKKAATQYKKFQTRELGKFTKKLQHVSELSADELQALGVSSELLAAAEQMQEEVEAQAREKKAKVAEKKPRKT
ncbi:ATP-binding protein [Variovorax sp. HJSM1_2]|uniref:ATP-binding protein n=1 Tax=Variovorax sp. HJSM1_2 TaxID=3366263 RepID=UPI003BE36EA4